MQKWIDRPRVTFFFFVLLEGGIASGALLGQNGIHGIMGYCQEWNTYSNYAVETDKDRALLVETDARLRREKHIQLVGILILRAISRDRHRTDRCSLLGSGESHRVLQGDEQIDSNSAHASQPHLL